MTHLGMSGHKLNKICGVIIIITILTHNTKKKTLGGVATKSMKSAASVAVLLIRRSMGFMATMRSSSMSSLCEGAGNGMSTSTLGPEVCGGGYMAYEEEDTYILAGNGMSTSTFGENMGEPEGKNKGDTDSEGHRRVNKKN
jgi:hypothetical protein